MSGQAARRSEGAAVVLRPAPLWRVRLVVALLRKTQIEAPGKSSASRRQYYVGSPT